MEETKKRKILTTKILNIVILSIFSFLLVCLITPFYISGIIGGFFRGLLGLSVYGIVIAGIVISACTLSGRRTLLQPKFVVTFTLLYISILLFVQLLSSNIYLQSSSSYGQYLTWCYSFQTYPSFGGLLAGLIVYPFYKVNYWLSLGLFLIFVCVMVYLSASRINDISTGNYQHISNQPRTSPPRQPTSSSDTQHTRDMQDNIVKPNGMSEQSQPVHKTAEQLQRDESLRILYGNIDFGRNDDLDAPVVSPPEYTQTRPDIPYVPVGKFDTINDLPEVDAHSSIPSDSTPPRPIVPPKTAYDGTRTVSSTRVRHITNTDVLDADEWSKRLRDNPNAQQPDADVQQPYSQQHTDSIAPSTVTTEQPKQPARKVLFEEPEPKFTSNYAHHTSDVNQDSSIYKDQSTNTSTAGQSTDDIDINEYNDQSYIENDKSSADNGDYADNSHLDMGDTDNTEDTDYIKPRPPVQQRSATKEQIKKNDYNGYDDDNAYNDYSDNIDSNQDSQDYDSFDQRISPADLFANDKPFSSDYNKDINERINKNQVTDKAKAYIDKILRDDEQEQSTQEDSQEDTINIVSKPVVLAGGKRGYQGAFDLEDTTKRKHAPTIHKYAKYMAPPVDLLKSIQINPTALAEDYEANARILEEMLAEFKIDAKVQHIVTGPTVTRYEMKMAPGIPIKKVSNIADDIAMRMSAVASIRIEAPIPGKDLFGVEIPNKKTAPVSLRNMIDSDEFDNLKGSLSFALGVDIGNERIFADLASFPHLLIAGSTGAGKSVCLNTMIVSLMYKYSPEDLKFLLVDPKQVEFFVYAKSPHLLIDGIITQPEQCIQALSWLIEEMERRYILLRDCAVKDINAYNKIIDTTVTPKMPRIVLIIDELNDLMTYNKVELENRIKSLSQKARAAGIHLVFATQRPSTDVLTGTIKANFPTRIALRVVSSYDAKTIMDTGGPDKLAGKGDMLFKSDNTPKPIRLQGAFVGNQEVDNVIQYIASKNEAYYDESATRKILTVKGNSVAEEEDDDTQDPLFIESLRYCVENNMASISSLQRRFNIGYNRAGRLITAFEVKGFVSAYNGSKSRTMIITEEEFDQLYPDE
ncbi:MAG: DNA translocase FtsK [Clostridia bacterium]|nr:DNA translocase FtsK [Clostridia bacterium]